MGEILSEVTHVVDIRYGIPSSLFNHPMPGLIHW